MSKELQARIFDTRKTIPGLRDAQKYAVEVGGGDNHRIGLFDQILIKENHIASAGSITRAIQAAREMHPTIKVEVEVETFAELEEAFNAQPDIIMLDNFDINALKEAVQERENAGLQHIELRHPAVSLKKISMRLARLVLIEFPLAH